MKTIELDIKQLKGAAWNANSMDEAMLGRLKESLRNFGLLQPLIVRPVGESEYEVLSGNQRLQVIRELGLIAVPCIIVDLNDHEARLLALALNDIRGSDDLFRKGNVLQNILSRIPQDKVISLLPETANSLKSLSTLGQEDLAQHLQAWQQMKAARLHHMQIQLTDRQLEVVERALALVTANTTNLSGDSPNKRGSAIFQLCRFYLDKNKKENQQYEQHQLSDMRE